VNCESLRALETAQRVLTALADKTSPECADVDHLRRIAPPLAHLPPEELARKVIHLAMAISGAGDRTFQPQSSDKASTTARLPVA
jgi:hypothetical protein